MRAQFEQSVGRAVLEYLTVDVVQGFKGALRCLDVGLAYVEMVNMHAVAFRLVCVRGEFTDRRERHILRPM